MTFPTMTGFMSSATGSEFNCRLLEYDHGGNEERFHYD